MQISLIALLLVCLISSTAASQCSICLGSDCSASSINVHDCHRTGEYSVELSTSYDPSLTYEWTASASSDWDFASKHLGNSFRFTMATSTPIAVVSLTVKSAGETIESCDREIRFSDTTLPEILYLPESSHKSAEGHYVHALPTDCDDLPVLPALIVRDSCDGDLSFTWKETSTFNQIIRSMEAQDSNDNTVSFVQTINLADPSKPTLSFDGTATSESTLNVQCDFHIPEQCEPFVDDNCGVNASSLSMTESHHDLDIASCSARKDRTWSVKDNHGNFNSITRQIYVQDTTKPSLIGVPPNVDVNCNEIPPIADVTAIDNCAGKLTVAAPIESIADIPDGDHDSALGHNEELHLDGCIKKILRRKWAVTDDCGNTATATQQIMVIDNEAPVISSKFEDGQTYDMECDDVPVVCDEDAVQDNCDGAITPVVTTTTTSTCANSYISTHSITAEDACGSQSSLTFTFNVVDSTAPVLMSDIAPEIIVDCDSLSADTPYFADNCDGREDMLVVLDETDFNGDDDFSQPDGFLYGLKRTWTATDQCGNAGKPVTQIVWVVDNVKPELVPAPSPVLTATCDAIPPPLDVAAIDNCGSICANRVMDVDFTEEPSNSLACAAKTYLRTWSTLDCSGLTSKIEQTLHVSDTIDPYFINLPAEAFDSISIHDFNENGYNWPDVQAEDSCGPASVDYSDDTNTPDCAHNMTIVRTYTASDACDNAINYVFTLTVSDNVVPEISNSDNHGDVQCDDERISEDWYRTFVLPSISASDNSGSAPDVTFTQSDDSAARGSCEFTVARTLTAVDSCGNSHSESWSFTVSDTQGPTLPGSPSLPDRYIELTDGLDKQPLIEDSTYPTTIQFEDACNSVTVIFDFTQVGVADACGSETWVRSWRSVDSCGNYGDDVISEKLIFHDTVSPILSVPDNAHFECLADVPSYSEADASASDPGREDTTVQVVHTVIPSSESSSCSGSFTNKWTAIDVCGQPISKEQTVTYSDNTHPTFTLADETVQVDCKDDIAAIKYKISSKNDNCDVNPSIIEASDVLSNDGTTRTIRLYAQDACGNKSPEQVFTVVADDTEAPVIGQVAGSDDFTCQEWGNSPGDATVNDNCDALADASPVASVANPSYLQFCASSGGLVQTWSYDATDNSGNDALTKTVAWTYVDNVAPVFDAFDDSSVTLECSSPQWPSPAASDSCTTQYIDVLHADSFSDASGAAINAQQASGLFNYDVTRTWTATDPCNNADSRSKTIKVRDTLAGDWASYAPATVLECNAPLPAGPSASDDCEGDLDAVESTTISTDISGQCSQDVTRRWEACDSSNNCIEMTYDHKIVDSNAPSFNNNGLTSFDFSPQVSISDPDNVYTVDTVEAALLSAYSDDCNTVTANCVATPEPGCNANDYSIDFDCTITDGCFVETFNQTLVLTDSHAPFFCLDGECPDRFQPPDMTSQCTHSAFSGTVKAIDDDNENYLVNFDESTVSSQCEHSYQIKRSWTSSDICSDIAEDQLIKVEDTTPPFNLPSGDRAYECDFESHYWTRAEENAQPTDICAGDVDYSVAIASSNCRDGFANQCDITYTITAVDACDNEATDTITQTVTDTTPPYLVFADSTGIENDGSDHTYNAGTIEVGDIAPAIKIYTAHDKCDGTPEEDISTSESGNECYKSWTMVSTHTDGVGLTTSFTQTWHEQDTIAPEWTGDADGVMPVDEECEYDDYYSTPKKCGGDAVNLNAFDAGKGTSYVDEPTETIEGRTGDNDYEFTIKRTWYVSDECDNDNEYVQIITLTHTPPAIVGVPHDKSIPCAEYLGIDEPQIDTLVAESLAIRDAIDQDLTNDEETVTVSAPVIVQGDADCIGQTITFTFTLTNSVTGQTDNDDYTISIVDNQQPQWNYPIPAAIEYECTIDIEPVSGHDACGDVIITNTETANDVTWFLTDACGNVATPPSIKQTWTIVDSYAPTWTSALPASQLTVDCYDDAPDAVDLIASDTCDTTVGTVAPTVVDTCGDSECGACSITRTWTASDGTNTIEHVQVIEVLRPSLDWDVDLPLAPLSNECSIDQPTYGVEHKCYASATVTPTSTTVGHNTVFKWTAVVDNGPACMTSVITQDASVYDTQDPGLDSVDDIAYECGTSTPSFAELGCTDQCDDCSTSSVPGDYTNETSCLSHLSFKMKTTTATDGFDNSEEAVQHLIPMDSTAPVIHAPYEGDSYTLLGCPFEVPAIQLLGASDSCVDSSLLTQVMTEGSAVWDDASKTWSVVHSWTVTDTCDNSDDYSQTITVKDVSPPVITASFTGSVDCTSALIGPDTDNWEQFFDISTSDNCQDEPSVSLSVSDETICDGSVKQTYTLTSTDGSGNVATATTSASFTDTIAPTISLTFNNTEYANGATIYVACEVEFTPVFAVGDNCGSVATSDIQESVSGQTHTYTIFDDCGNSESITITVEEVDYHAPTTHDQEPKELECHFGSASLRHSEFAEWASDAQQEWEANGQDNCGSPSFTYDGTPTDLCNATLKLTATATDDSGLTSTGSASLFIFDITPPSIDDANRQDSYSVECSGNYQQTTEWIDFIKDLPYHDECLKDRGSYAVSFTDASEAQLDIGQHTAQVNEVITKTITVVDHCGLEDERVETFELIDSHEPNFVNLPVSQTVECVNENFGALSFSSSVMAYDACDGSLEVVNTTEASIGNCLAVHTTTFVSVDGVGNEAVDVHTYTIRDTTQPELTIRDNDQNIIDTIPAELTLSCDDKMPNYNIQALDSCFSVITPSFAMSEEDKIVGKSTGTTTRTWTVHDGCSDPIVLTQVITWMDEIAPEIEGVPTNTAVSFQCVADAAIVDGFVSQVGAYDTCGDSDLTNSIVSTPNPNCPYDVSVEYTFVATDQVDNSATATWGYTLADSEPPVISINGEQITDESITVECDQVPEAGEATANDNCSGQVDVDYTVTKEEGLEVRTWTAEDECGLKTVVVHTITIVDTTPPVFVNLPTVFNFECPNFIDENHGVTAVDNCDEDVQVTFTDVETHGESGGCCDRTVERTFTTCDEANNCHSETLTFSTSDSLAPIVRQYAGQDTILPDIQVNTQDIPPLSFYEESYYAMDISGSVVVVSVSETFLDSSAQEEITSEDCDAWKTTKSYTIERVITFTDGCGHEVVKTHSVHVIDSIPPFFNHYPENAEYDCDSVPGESECVEVVGEVGHYWHTHYGSHCDDNGAEAITVHKASSDSNIDVDAKTKTITNTWSAVDIAGNTQTHTQVITIVDDDAPTFSRTPAAIVTHECSCDEFPEPLLEIADDCDNHPELEYSQLVTTSSAGSIHKLVHQFTRSWVATDDFGNINELSQIVNVIDTTPGAFLVDYSDTFTLEVGQSYSAPAASLHDACDSSDTLSIDAELVRTDSLSCGSERREVWQWNHEDASGNKAVMEKQVDFIDTSAPAAVYSGQDNIGSSVYCFSTTETSEYFYLSDPFNTDKFAFASSEDLDSISIEAACNSTLSEESSSELCPVNADSGIFITIPRGVAKASSGGNYVFDINYSVKDSCDNELLVRRSIRFSDVSDCIHASPATVGDNYARNLPGGAETI